ncbi:uncharacterized protein LOC133713615 [Rosa rugosa]|uniref:uncharacterized protein LOC133713615 n=1 Tax=Rosa rugosa TaxID=74645 RepID=UPI002B4032D4|nr:uncharacterized protein LOC133713615 [Rosa rugosa]
MDVSEVQIDGSMQKSGMECQVSVPKSASDIIMISELMEESNVGISAEDKEPHCEEAQDLIIETAEAESGFGSVGYVANVHGLQGEIRVKPSTDFPELRFAEPGRRWLREQI